LRRRRCRTTEPPAHAVVRGCRSCADEGCRNGKDRDRRGPNAAGERRVEQRQETPRPVAATQQLGQEREPEQNRGRGCDAQRDPTHETREVIAERSCFEVVNHPWLQGRSVEAE
jgi:hypothetical protein